MALLGAIQRQSKWLWPLLLILPAVLLGSWLSELHYRYIERPRLVSQAGNPPFTPCESFSSALPGRAPRSCDLASSAVEPGGTTTDTFVFSDASKLTVVSQNGRWRSSSTECRTASRLSTVSIIGFALFGVAIVGHSLRTGQWMYFPGMDREPMNDFETVFALYGATIFAGNFIALAAAKCTAMALI
jgi:hypothetical protein